MSVMEMAAKTKFADLTFDQKLDRLAEVAVQVGLGLRADQELIMSAPLEALPLVRRITEHAYRAGALLVTTFVTVPDASPKSQMLVNGTGIPWATALTVLVFPE